MPPSPLSPTDTLVDGNSPANLSPVRRYVLLIIFCLAAFLDAFNSNSLYSAIPSLVLSLGITESESTWVISAFQLTFASFLLVSGRISDVYNPKAAFITGVALLGIISLGAGFSSDKVVLIVLRALTGIAAALTIPSALTLIVNIFTEPLEQARAIGLFGGCGCVGNVLGLIIGAFFVQFASWRWVFWFLALMTTPIALACVVIVPPQATRATDIQSKVSKFKSLDLVGISLLTVALILFIFALTSGSTKGWGSPLVLVPLISAICLIGCFLGWETHKSYVVNGSPPRTWFYPNFSVLFAVALVPYFWWTTVSMVFTTLWQEVYHWTVISSAAHMLPIGVMAFVASFTGSLSRVIDPKWMIITGQVLVTIATLLLAFADRPDRYWTFVFPGFVIGSTGAMLCYTHTNIAIFHTTPPSMAGTVGAIFNGALQLGSAIGLAAVTSIETSVEEVHGGFCKYRGRAAVFWFLLSIFAVQTVGVLVFYRNRSATTVSGSNNAGDRDEKFTVILDLRDVLRNAEFDSAMLDR
ncbi:hypothetical protein PILCRDRAFT_63090 [Piloderma croceum F 1598]|uniref:Major facilitator superfamily (MFS) profile domain-containing protein n=1 Tax=Piloderma croceum (strain F 1598) TaxID=765440 RepID=A0A0C3BNG3_PILCF|nr:hypothetical protein PILCRDRAFT_63090 [Piloderma croceum F 1598]